MARRKERTGSEKDRAKDKRLRSKYGITLADYHRILEAQGGKCAICGRPASTFAVSLNCDHEHPSISVARTNDFIGEEAITCKWFACTILKNGDGWTAYAPTRAAALSDLKARVLPHTVRGLLCPGRHPPGCNRRMGLVDDIAWLEKVVAYLKDPPAKKVLTQLAPPSTVIP